jgi:hypothetical protein
VCDLPGLGVAFILASDVEAHRTIRSHPMSRRPGSRSKSTTEMVMVMPYREAPKAYALVKPPFTLHWREMSKQELRDHYTSFLNALPRRIEELEAEVQRSDSFATWRADFSPASLDILGAWFVGQVETRPRTPEELEEIKRGLKIRVKVSNDELTDRTFSLASDVGMYLGRMLEKARPELKWELRMDDKTSVDYGRPVLAGFAKHQAMNPISIAVTLAQGIVRKNRGHERLRDLYNVWLEFAN